MTLEIKTNIKDQSTRENDSKKRNVCELILNSDFRKLKDTAISDCSLCSL
jgi:hypothetical protein